MLRTPWLFLLLMGTFVSLLAPCAQAEPWAVSSEPAQNLKEQLLGAGLASAVSAATLVLGTWQNTTLGASGPLGGTVFLAGIAALPPAALVVGQSGGFATDSFLASLSGGVLGLGLGFVTTRQLGGDSPSSGQLAARVAAMAIGQGIGSEAGYALYQWYKGFATDLNQLPEHRKDDPIKDWSNYKQRRNP